MQKQEIRAEASLAKKADAKSKLVQTILKKNIFSRLSIIIIVFSCIILKIAILPSVSIKSSLTIKLSQTSYGL